MKFEVAKILRKKYPQYAYILTIEDPNDINKRSTQRKYSTISSTPQFKNSKQPMPIAESKYLFIKYYNFFLFLNVYL